MQRPLVAVSSACMYLAQELTKQNEKVQILLLQLQHEKAEHNRLKNKVVAVQTFLREQQQKMGKMHDELTMLKAASIECECGAMNSDSDVAEC